jgi:flagellin
MASLINTNINTLTAQRNLGMSQTSLSTSMQRLSSGLRINSAKDDAAGLGISDRMTSQVRGLNQGARNAMDGISLAQTAEGALSTITDMVQRMRDLAVQGANGTNSDDDLKNLDAEYQKLITEIARIGTATKFNGKTILDGADAKEYTFQAGANKGDSIKVTTVAVSTYITAATLDATTAPDQIAAMDTALLAIAKDRGDLGASQNMLQFAIQNLNNASEQQASARSRILDADFASETANLSRAQILQQAGTAMVAQANQLPQGVLALLR